MIVQMSSLLKNYTPCAGYAVGRYTPFKPLQFMPICGLCKKEKELKKSHLMPKSLYGAIRNAFPKEGKEIVSAKLEQRSANYSDYQVKKPFLCGSCEQRFNRKGENVVTRECHRGAEKFTLLDKVQSSEERYNLEGERWIDPNKIESIDYQAYSYFALSVIWRASAGEWPKNVGVLKNTLGMKYEKLIRKYLLGESDFPNNIYTAVYVDRDEDCFPFMGFPTATKKNGYHHHIFFIPGVKFSILIGSKVGSVEELFKTSNTSIYFVEYSFRKSKDFKQVEKFLKHETKAKGRLAKDIYSV